MKTKRPTPNPLSEPQGAQTTLDPKYRNYPNFGKRTERKPRLDELDEEKED